MTTDPRWYESSFGDEWLQIAPARDPDGEETRAQVDFVLQRLELEPGARILDVACGHGRHALELARRGYRVTGTDLSEPSLELARESAREAGVEVDYTQANMLELPWRDEFDGALNLFSSFAYFPEEAEDEQAARSIAATLKPGGRFVLDVFNPIVLVSDRFDQRGWEELPDGRFVLEERAYDAVAGRSSSTFRVVRPDGTQGEFSISLRAYTHPELAALLRRAGFEPVSVHGGWEGEAFTRDTWRMILTARRPC